MFSNFVDIDQGVITMVLGDIKQATEDTKTAPNKTRGAPEGKASFEGYAEDGKGKYKSNFPKGPYRVTINIKEKSDGTFVYGFLVEKQERLNTPRTLHAVVNGGETTANVQPYSNSISPSEKKSTPFEKNSFGKTSRELDTDYLNAVERGDMETSQRFNEGNEDIRYSRDLDIEGDSASEFAKPLTNRELLANALLDTVKNQQNKRLPLS